ncbi:MAG TPA: PhnD/SsuA/transferrin family substrate-binding protein [Candidatus Acidoferrum sp.]|nr:PhnD/SsuA/transferrin family substrate-binding protein [Candidatus Acidoferrum sp.]
MLAAALLALCGVLSSARVHAEDGLREITIGTVNGQLRLGAEAGGHAELFNQYLDSQISGYRFRVVPYDTIDQLLSAGEGDKIDFAFVTPVAYVQLAHSHEVRTLATVTQEVNGNMYPWLAGSVFVRADRADLQQMMDAKKKKVEALSPLALGGWLSALREWHKLGIDQDDLAGIDFNFSYEGVLQAVCNGSKDVGVLPSSIFEVFRHDCAMPLRVLHMQPAYENPRYPIDFSTRVYPEVAFVEITVQDERLVNQLTMALLGLMPGSEAAKAINVGGFTPPLKYDSVEALMRELQLAPFGDVEQQTISQFLQQNRGKLAIVMFMLAGVLVIAYISNVLLQRKVRQSEFLRNQIFSSSQFAVAVIDAATLEFVDVNHAAVRLFGYRRADELKGMTPMMLAPSDGQGSQQVNDSIEAIRRELKGGLKPLVFEWSLCRPGGEQWNADGHIVPFRWGNGLYMLLTVMDVTEHKRILREQERMQQQLQQAERLESIGRFSGAIAHDFNNLLTVINGYSELLLLNAAADDERLHVYREIIQACSRAGELTNQLLTFSRRRMAKMEALDLNRLVNQASSLFRRLLGETITVRTQLCSGPAVTLADAGQLHQVLMNFAANARDAMPDGGEFFISTVRCRVDATQARQLNVAEGDYIKLEVSDTGTGMTQEVQSKIFEPFFTTKGERGTGFGLATAYGIVRQCHGNITFESMPGLGTVFTVYLPVSTAATAAVNETTASQSFDLAGPLTVLLVEDEREVRSFASMVLQSAGCKVFGAESGAEAIALAREHGSAIDVVFTDVVLGDISGTKLAAQLQELLPSASVLFTSGYANDEQAFAQLLQGQTGFIAKPYSPATLLARIRTLSEHGRLPA